VHHSKFGQLMSLMCQFLTIATQTPLFDDVVGGGRITGAVHGAAKWWPFVIIPFGHGPSR
jgi:hypothetical protein